MGAGLKNTLVVELFWKKQIGLFNKQTNKQTNNMRGSQESTAQGKLANSDNILNTGGQLSEGLGDLHVLYPPCVPWSIPVAVLTRAEPGDPCNASSLHTKPMISAA